LAIKLAPTEPYKSGISPDFRDSGIPGKPENPENPEKFVTICHYKNSKFEWRGEERDAKRCKKNPLFWTQNHDLGLENNENDAVELDFHKNAGIRR